MAFSCASAAVALTVVLLFVVPRAEVAYKDWGMKLPAMTIAVLHFARFCYRGGIVAVWAVFAAVPFIPPLFDAQPNVAPRRRYFSLPRLLLTLFLLLLFGWIILALLTPYVNVINAMTNSAKKR